MCRIKKIIVILCSIFILFQAQNAEAKKRVEKIYYRNKKLKKLIVYKNEKEVRTKSFSLKGRIISEYKSLSDVDTYYVERLYHSNGNVKVFVKKNKKKWIYITYYPNGKVEYYSEHRFLKNRKANIVKKKYNKKGKLILYSLDEGIDLVYGDMPSVLRKVDEDYYLSMIKNEKKKMYMYSEHLKDWGSSLDREEASLPKSAVNGATTASMKDRLREQQRWQKEYGETISEMLRETPK